MLQFIFFISSDLLYKKKKNIILIGDKKITEFDFLPDEIKEIQNINFVTYKNYDEFISSKNNEIHEIIITKDSIQEQELNFSKKMTIRGIKIYTLLQWIEKTFNRTPCELLSPYEYFKSNYIPLYNFQLRIKRLGDIFLSLILLIILLPINLLLMIFIKLEDGGPIFYSQLRNGFKNKEFKIWKFRSMKIDAENSGPKWADRYDKRITKIGTIIRKMRLDETPQLINVIVGQMSLIGPRPERPEMDKDLNQKINLYSQRYAIRPGLSGWAQVNYPYGASIEDAKNKLSFDLFY
ncbi:sugar transferase, partial [Prochlorococcus sp. AH-736-L15]